MKWNNIDISSFQSSEIALIIKKITSDKKAGENGISYNGKKYRIVTGVESGPVLQFSEEIEEEKSEKKKKTNILKAMMDAEINPESNKRKRSMEEKAVPKEDFLYGSFKKGYFYSIEKTERIEGKDYITVIDGFGEKYVILKKRFKVVSVYSEPPLQ